MKHEDRNGFWEIENNPISCAGVYPYLGAHLPGAPDPTRVYMVLRPPEELGRPETVASFKLQPWTIGHAMLGPKEEGLTPPEEAEVQGVIGERVYFDAKADPPTLFANIKGFSEKLKKAIAAGLKQLSAGYFHDVEWKSGVWNGQAYDAIQRNISGNHLASVPSGRMGPGVAVMDSLRGFDPNPFTVQFTQPLEDDGMTLEELFGMVKALAERLKALESATSGASAAGKDSAGACAAGKDNGGEAGKDTGGATAAGGSAAASEAAGKDNADAVGKDEDGASPDLSLDALAEALKAITERLERLEGGSAAAGGAATAGDSEGAEAAGKDEDGEGKKDEEGKNSGSSMDAALLHKRILRDIAGRDTLARELLPRVGTFDYSLMTEKEVAAYGCNKLGVPYARGHESTAIRAYLKGAGAAGPVFSMDSAFARPASGGVSETMQRYLAGGK